MKYFRYKNDLPTRYGLIESHIYSSHWHRHSPFILYDSSPFMFHLSQPLQQTYSTIAIQRRSIVIAKIESPNQDGRIKNCRESGMWDKFGRA